MEACFRRHSPAAAAKQDDRHEGDAGKDPRAEAAAATPSSAPSATTFSPAAALVPSSQAFDEDVSAPLATAVIRSLRFFRAAAAGTEAASIPGEEDEGGERGHGGGHTPAVSIQPDGSITIDDGHRRVALAGLRLAGAVATAPGPARALLEAGGFHVLWRLPLDPAATPMGVALALGALCQGIRHADVLRVFLTRWEGDGDIGGGVKGGEDGAAGGGLARLGGYEACASVLSRQVRRGREEMEMGWKGRERGCMGGQGRKFWVGPLGGRKKR